MNAGISFIVQAPGQMFAGKARSLPMGAPESALLGYAPALPANIRLGRRGLPGTNTLAYYANL
jgi:hypothetical protein